MPLVLPFGLIVVIALLASGLLALDWTATSLYALAMSTLLSVTLLITLVGKSFSVLSIGLLAFTYVIVCVTHRVPNTKPPEILRETARAFSLSARPLAIFGLAQIGLQATSFGYFDPVSLLPPQWTLSGYNTTYPLLYSFPLLRANGMFALEPSFYAQFCALAFLASIVGRFRRAWWWQLIFALGILSAGSGTGLLLLFFGIFVLTVGGTLKLRAPIFLGLLAGGTAVMFSPLAPVFTSRITEFGIPGSSGNLRFIAAYDSLMYEVVRSSTWITVALGNGAGTVGDVSDVPGAQAPVIAKLFYEYGMVGFCVFAASMGLIFFKRHMLSWRIVVIFMYLFLASNLLSPVVVWLSALLLVVVRAEAPPVLGDAQGPDK